jgi:hypothetical protein
MRLEQYKSTLHHSSGLPKEELHCDCAPFHVDSQIPPEKRNISKYEDLKSGWEYVYSFKNTTKCAGGWCPILLKGVRMV